MKPSNLPTPIVRGAMHVTPPFVLARAVAMLLRGMERAHPKLFQNLARLKPSIVYVEPTDLPHRFELYGGDEKPTVRVLGCIQERLARWKPELQKLPMRN